MAVYVAPAALGLGDLVVTLPVVQHFIESGQKTHLIVRLAEHLPLAARVPGLAGAIAEWDFDERKLRTSDEYFDLRDHYLQKRYWWGSREFELAYPGYKINDILKVICTDLGIEADLNVMRPLRANHVAAFSSTVLFVPGSAVSAKHWQTEAWVELATRLQSDGREVRVIGEPQRCAAVAQLLAAGLVHYPTETIADALDALSSCSAVVSVDTGLMHLAVHQGTPSVGLFKRTPVYVRPQKHFRAIVAERACLDVCHEKERRCAHNDRACAGPAFSPINWACQAPSGARCMETVAVDAVMRALGEVAPPVVAPVSPPLFV